MIDIDKWQEIFGSIRRHKLRTALTAFGVGWGIFTLVLMLGAIDGLVGSFTHSFRDDAINSIFIWRGETSKDFAGLNKGRRIQFDNSDFEFLKDNFSEIEDLTGRFYLGSSLMFKYKKEALAFSTRGVHPGHKILENTKIEEGRYINEEDISQARKVIVLGRVAKEQLMGDDPAIGNEVNLGGVFYKIIGVFSDSGGEDEEKICYLPISTAQRIYSNGQEIHQLMVAGGDLSIDGMRSLEDEIRIAFAQRKQFDPTDRRALRMFNRAESFQEFSSLFSAFTILTWIIGFFSIMAGVISVSNIMLIIVKDRTKEIGIRKAIGATPGSIIAMILQESILITGVAGYIGMICGVGIIYALSGSEAEYFRHPSVDIGVVITATLILVISGALAGLIPALKAANINPVTAIKSD
ncbi:MAG: putative ABC transport system permease protein [Saprospiraceae bacterium]|jgi:putative ABC transport system permease protein